MPLFLGGAVKEGTLRLSQDTHGLWIEMQDPLPVEVRG